MTKTQLIKIGDECVNLLRQASPIDTGNLRHNAIRAEVGEDYYKIYVDENIAPYMVFTNEPWLSPKWNGKKNHNEHWFDKVAESIALYVAKRLHGELNKKGD